MPPGTAAGADAPARLRLSSPDCVKILDRDGVVRSINDDGLRSLEIERIEQVAGSYWPDFWPENDRALATAALDGARVHGVASFVAECPTALGKAKWWDVTVAAVPGSGEFCVISRDITQQRKAQQITAAIDERSRSALAGSGMIGLWDWPVATDRIHGDAAFARLYGLDRDATAAGLTEAEYQRFVVAEDLPALRAAIRATFDAQQPFLVEYRLAVPGQPLRWVECRGRMVAGADGRPERFSGTAIDVTLRRLADDQRQLLMHELAHRLKNSLAMVQAIAQRTFHGADAAMLAAFHERLAALALAHDILLLGDRSASTVADVVARVTELAGTDARVSMAGGHQEIGPQATLTLSLLLHELVTNAIKHGALSAPGGRVTIAWQSAGDDLFSLEWREAGGPAVSPPTRRGFGSRLLALGLGDGESAIDYAPSGMTAAFTSPLSRLAH